MVTDRKLIDIPRESIGLDEEGVRLRLVVVDGGRLNFFLTSWQTRSGESCGSWKSHFLWELALGGCTVLRMVRALRDVARICYSTHAFPAPSFNLPPTPKFPTVANFFTLFPNSQSNILSSRIDSTVT